MLSRHVSITIAAMISAILSLPANAADINSYRAGQTYLKAPAGNAMMCEAQCGGDALCRGWNFLRSGAPDGSGVCEFNSSISAVTPHPYAISGQAQNIGYQSSALISGQTRTTRIGEPLTVRPQAEIRAEIKAAIAPKTIQASTRAPQRPQTQIGTAQSNPQTVTRHRVFAPQAASLPTKPATLGGPLGLVRPTQTQSAPVQRPLNRQLAAPQQLSLKEQQDMQRQSQIQHQAKNQALPQIQTRKAMPQTASRQAPMPQNAPAAASQSLYGSLHDAPVTAPKSVVKRSPIPTDVTAPIATAHAAPTGYVQESRLEMAGGAE